MKNVILVIYGIIMILILSGWIQCLVKFCKCDFKESYKAEVIYGAGLCTGTGCIIGWFDFGK